MCDAHGGCGSCSGGGTIAAFSKLVQYNIRANGYSIAFAFDSTPGYAYTVGVEETWGHPEFIVFGLAPDASDRVLRGIVDLVRRGVLPDDAAHTGAEIEGGKALLEELSPDAASRSMVQTRDYYGERPFRTLQVIWPG
jgi:hypothetical protein